MKFNIFANSKLSSDIAIDIGTDMTLVYIKNEGLILKKPSFIAVDAKGEAQAVGEEAFKMYGKEPKTLRVIKPVRDGKIHDFDMAVKMVSHFIKQACQSAVIKPRVIVSVPAGASEVEKKAYYDVLRSANARSVYMMDEPLCAADGAGCDVSLARGLLVADIGAGRSDIASISFGRCVVQKSIAVAGNTFTDEIIKYIKANYHLNIGFLTAEEIKKNIGNAMGFEFSKSMEVAGCDTESGMPKRIAVSSEEIRDVLQMPLKKISIAIMEVLENTPFELQQDILEDGVLLTGGGAMLFGIDKWMRNETNLKVFVTENMDECVIKGLGEQLLKLDINAIAPEKYYFDE